MSKSPSLSKSAIVGNPRGSPCDNPNGFIMGVLEKSGLVTLPVFS